MPAPPNINGMPASARDRVAPPGGGERTDRDERRGDEEHRDEAHGHLIAPARGRATQRSAPTRATSDQDADRLGGQRVAREQKPADRRGAEVAAVELHVRKVAAICGVRQGRRT